jgi:1,4-dihydroxy-2-naphthoate octaprenyltransferase
MAEASYKPFTLKAALELTSPPTWVASVMSVLVGGVAAFSLSSLIPLTIDARAIGVWALMFVVAVLMQSAVNTFNDYQDFKAGIDTAETILDINDASIVYNEIDPRNARNLAVRLLALAAVVGLIVVVLSGWPLLIVGLLAAGAVLLYSFGPKPISYLPLGELISGVVMGGFITSSTYFAMALDFSPMVLTVTVPPIITIALIMQTNNTCDIERDIVAKRHTLPAWLGRERSIGVARVLAWLTPIYMVIWVAAFDVIIWRSSLLLLVDMVIAIGLYFLLRRRLERIGSGPYNLVNRGAMMGNIARFCRLVNLSWVAVLLICYLVGDLFFGMLMGAI